MSNNDFIDTAKKSFADFMMPDRVTIEKLRKILEAEQKRPITHREAEEVGIELVSLYKCLAGNRPIIKEEEL